MDKIKTLIEKLNNKFNRQKAFNKKRECYLQSFKKSYQERTLSEKLLVECLYNLEFMNSNNARFCGAAEAILVIENVIKEGHNFNYIIHEEKLLFFKIKVKETYKEHIIRIIKEYLTENGVI